MSPWLSNSPVTADLLGGAGYRYFMGWTCDDQPIRMKTRKGRILATPYPIETSDNRAIVWFRYSPSELADVLIDNFGEMLEQSARQPLLCPISLHPFVTGRPYRIRQLRRAFRHILRAREEPGQVRGASVVEGEVEMLVAAAEQLIGGSPFFSLWLLLGRVQVSQRINVPLLADLTHHLVEDQGAIPLRLKLDRRIRFGVFHRDVRGVAVRRRRDELVLPRHVDQALPPGGQRGDVNRVVEHVAGVAVGIGGDTGPCR
jgi:hypothetical protein